MTRIVISTFGASGGLNPFLSLGLRLRARGHDVLFVVEKNFSSMLVEAGFTVFRMTGNGESIFADYPHQMFEASNPIPSFRVIVEKWILTNLRLKIEELRVACTGANVLVARAGHLAAPIVSDLVGIPWIHVTMTPSTIPSAQHGPLTSRTPSLANLTASPTNLTASPQYCSAIFVDGGS